MQIAKRTVQQYEGGDEATGTAARPSRKPYATPMWSATLHEFTKKQILSKHGKLKSKASEKEDPTNPY